MLTNLKANCWEFKKCGREPGGLKAVELGVCPSAITSKYDGVHGGKNAGRICWVVAGTLCKGEVQGSFAQKIGNCQKCDFHLHVLSEEMNNFRLYK